LDRKQSLKESRHLRNTDFNEKLISRSLKIAAFIMLVISIYTIAFGENNIFEYYKKVQFRNELMTQVESIKKENQDLERKIQYLQNDPFYIEKLARENLGLMKDNEEIYVIVGMEKKQKEEAQQHQQEERWIDKIKEKYQQFKLQ